jgi:hypothetical protein
MRARAVVGLSLAGAFAVVAAGCDWREFDDLKTKTLVASISPPSGYDVSDDFGRILVPLVPPADGSAAARFVTSATLRTGIGVMTLDAAGQAGGTTPTGGALTALGGDPVRALAPVPGGQQMLLGAPNGMLGGDVMVMSLTPPYAVTAFQREGDVEYGVGLGAGNIGGGPAPEFVVTSSTKLHVYVDGQASNHVELEAANSAGCPIDFSFVLPERARRNRPVIVADLLASGTQIAVGTPATSGPGHVSIFNVDVTTGTFTCALSLTATESTESQFGVSMALGDFDGDGKQDLLVGAPPNRVYMYRWPVTATATAMLSSRGTAGAAFGASVTAFNLDGTAGDEALVGDPDADVGGESGAGNVQIFTGPMLAGQLPSPMPSTLTAFEVKAGTAYGSAVAGLRFCPGAGGADGGAPGACVNLALVGASARALAYFTIGHADPRVK